MTDITVSSQSTQLECDNVRVNFAYNRKLNTMNKLLNYIAQALFLFFQVPEGFFVHSVAQFGSDIRSIRQVTHRSHHFTLLLPNSFLQWFQYWSRCRNLARARYGNRESRIENRYCTRDKKRSPSKEQLMQCKSFKLLRIANSGLQAVKELLRSVQIIKELWRPVSHA